MRRRAGPLRGACCRLSSFGRVDAFAARTSPSTPAGRRPSTISLCCVVSLTGAKLPDKQSVLPSKPATQECSVADCGVCASARARSARLLRAGAGVPGGCASMGGLVRRTSWAKQRSDETTPKVSLGLANQPHALLPAASTVGSSAAAAHHSAGALLAQSSPRCLFRLLSPRGVPRRLCHPAGEQQSRRLCVRL